MKKLALLIGLVLVTLSPTFAAPAQSLNRIVAIVNNDVITQSDLDLQTISMQQQLKAMNQPVSPDLKKQVLDQLIDAKLTLQIAQKAGITVSDAQLTAAIDSIAKQNNLTTAQLIQQVQKQGMNYKDYQQQIRNQILMNAAERQAVGNKIQISAAEISAAMKKAASQMQAMPEYHLLGLLVPLAPNASPADKQAAQNQASTIVQQLQQGADFATIAENQPVGTAPLQGGDMGWEQLSQLPPAVEAQVASALTGSIVGPIQMPTGFYVLKIVEIKTPKADQNASTTDLKNQVQQMLYMQKFQKAVMAWLKQLRTTAYIKIMNS